MILQDFIRLVLAGNPSKTSMRRHRNHMVVDNGAVKNMSTPIIHISIIVSRDPIRNNSLMDTIIDKIKFKRTKK
jgi:hypothetical protein